MTARITKELQALGRRFPGLEYVESGQWVLLPEYAAPPIWDHTSIAVAFQIPGGYPGQKPYAFHVRPRIQLVSKQQVQSYQPSTEPPFPGEWGKFSWDLPEWHPTVDLASGSNLLNWAHSFRSRLDEGA